MISYTLCYIVISATATSLHVYCIKIVTELLSQCDYLLCFY